MSDFNPEEYLKSVGKQPADEKFDPNAYLQAVAPVPREKTGLGTAMARGAGQGFTLGFNSELQGATDTLQDRIAKNYELLTEGDGLKNIVKNGTELLLHPETGVPRLVGNAVQDLSHSVQHYRQVRDSEDRKDEAAKEDHPVGYGLTEVATSAPAMLASGGGPEMGALLGGTTALGHSKADLTRGEFGQAAADTVPAAAFGAVAGKYPLVGLGLGAGMTALDWSKMSPVEKVEALAGLGIGGIGAAYGAARGSRIAPNEAKGQAAIQQVQEKYQPQIDEYSLKIKNSEKVDPKILAEAQEGIRSKIEANQGRNEVAKNALQGKLEAEQAVSAEQQKADAQKAAVQDYNAKRKAALKAANEKAKATEQVRGERADQKSKLERDVQNANTAEADAEMSAKMKGVKQFDTLGEAVRRLQSIGKPLPEKAVPVADLVNKQLLARAESGFEGELPGDVEARALEASKAKVEAQKAAAQKAMDDFNAKPFDEQAAIRERLGKGPYDHVSPEELAAMRTEATKDLGPAPEVTADPKRVASEQRQAGLQRQIDLRTKMDGAGTARDPGAPLPDEHLEAHVQKRAAMKTAAGLQNRENARDVMKFKRDLLTKAQQPEQILKVGRQQLEGLEVADPAAQLIKHGMDGVTGGKFGLAQRALEAVIGPKLRTPEMRAAYQDRVVQKLKSSSALWNKFGGFMATQVVGNPSGVAKLFKAAETHPDLAQVLQDAATEAKDTYKQYRPDAGQ